jgi:hypothetical protein
MGVWHQNRLADWLPVVNELQLHTRIVTSGLYFHASLTQHASLRRIFSALSYRHCAVEEYGRVIDPRIFDLRETNPGSHWIGSWLRYRMWGGERYWSYRESNLNPQHFAMSMLSNEQQEILEDTELTHFDYKTCQLLPLLLPSLLDQWYLTSSFLVRVHLDVISLQLCTPQDVGI